MNCGNIESLLLAERDGVLTADQQASLEQHVGACPGCRRFRAGLAEAMHLFRADAASIAVPDVDDEWHALQSQLPGRKARPAKKRPLAPVIWIGAPLAAAAALTLAYLGWPQKPVEQFSSDPNIAEAEYVEAGDANASTMVYVDKESGWLVVWAADNDAATKG